MPDRTRHQRGRRRWWWRGRRRPNPPTPVPDALQQLKDYARQQIRVEFEQVLYPCLVTSTGVATFISLLPTGPAIPIVVGGGLVATGGPLCAKGVARLYQLQLIYNDPPNFDFHEITRIASTRRADAPAALVYGYLGCRPPPLPAPGEGHVGTWTGTTARRQSPRRFGSPSRRRAGPSKRASKVR